MQIQRFRSPAAARDADCRAVKGWALLLPVLDPQLLPCRWLGRDRDAHMPQRLPGLLLVTASLILQCALIMHQKHCVQGPEPQGKAAAVGDRDSRDRVFQARPK